MLVFFFLGLVKSFFLVRDEGVLFALHGFLYQPQADKDNTQPQ